MLGYGELVASTVMYGMGIVAQSVAARRAERRPGTGLGLLARLASDRLYLAGFAGQVGGFVLAFFARASLPLYLVQAGSSSAIGLATIFGVLALGWRVHTAEVAVLVVMAFGLILLAGSSAPSIAQDLSSGAVAVLFGVLVLTAGLAVFACRATAVVPTAVLAGVAFSLVAIASRSLAHHDLSTLLPNPLTWLMLVSAVLGQACMAVALQHGSATSVVASCDSITIVLASITGIAVLGDQVMAGRQWWVVLGLALVVLGVLVLGSMPRLTAAVRLTPAKEAA